MSLLTEIQERNPRPFLIFLGLLCLALGLIGWDGALAPREHNAFWVWGSISRILFYLPAAVFLLITQVEFIRSRMSNWFHGAMIGFAIYTIIYLSKDILVVYRLDHRLQDVFLLPSSIFAGALLDPLHPLLTRTFGTNSYGPIGFLFGIWFGSIPFALIGGLFATSNRKLVIVAWLLAIVYGVGSLFGLILLILDMFGLHYFD